MFFQSFSHDLHHWNLINLIPLTCVYTPAAYSVGALADLSLSHLGGGVARRLQGCPSIIILFSDFALFIMDLKFAYGLLQPVSTRRHRPTV